MILYISIIKQAKAELRSYESWGLLTLYTDTLGWYSNNNSVLENSISEIAYLKNEHLTEINRDEEHKSRKNTLENSTYFNWNMKQEYTTRGHSLSWLNSTWIVIFLRDISIWDYSDRRVIRSLDSVKLTINSYINTTLKANLSLKPYNLNQRRLYSTNSNNSLQRLEDIKIELESILVPKLKKNVLDFKKNAKTVWILDESNSDAITIKKGVKLYTNICAFLISIKTSIEFTRYLNFKFNLRNINRIYDSIPSYSGKDKFSDGTYLGNNMEDKEINRINNLNEEINKLQEVCITSKNFTEYNSRNRFSNVCREKLKNTDNWTEILFFSKLNMENIIFKYWAVEKIYRTNGAKTPGIDGIAFKSISRGFKSNEKDKAKDLLASKYKKYSHILSILTGKNDQSIQRKGIDNLNSQERLRRHLKTPEGRVYVMKLRDELKYMKNDPVGYANNLYYESVKYNNELKFHLCKYIKNTNLLNYKSKGILRIFIPKSKGKTRPLDIPTLFDRTIQMLLKLVMEPYMEPLGDEFSFGFRPGRNCHQATAYIHNRLQFNRSANSLSLKRRTSLEPKMRLMLLKIKTIANKQIPLNEIDPSNNIKITIPGFGENIVRRKQIEVPSWLYEKATNKSKKIVYDTQYIINAEIKGCFDNIDHNWLIQNVPMPLGYEYLLPRILKCNILELETDNCTFNEYTIQKKQSYKNILESSNNNIGIPQGGIIYPLLMNWTLDGLQHFIKNSAHQFGASNNLYSIDRANMMKKRDNKGNIKSDTFFRNKTRIEWYNTTWFIRFAEDFLVGCKSETMANLLKDAITDFLKPRGLTLSVEKTKIIPWKMNRSVDFLGWTHHLIYPKKVNWLIRTSKHNAGKLIDWIGTYTYPSQKSTKRLREGIKELTSNTKNYLTMDSQFIKINELLRGWSNYFSPAPQQRYLRRHLDVYIWKRLRKFFMNKFQQSFHDIFMKHFSMEVKATNPKAFFHNKSLTHRVWLDSPTISNDNSEKGNLRKSSLNILNLTKLDIPSLWTILTPSKELFLNSMLVNPRAYVKRALLIRNLRKDSQSILLFKQKHNCTICNKSLINWESLLNFDNNDIDNIFNDLKYTETCYKADDFKLLQTDKFDSNNKKVNINTINLFNNRVSNWLSDTQIDHIIPSILGGNVLELKNILNKSDNLQLIHKNCHNSKINQDINFLKVYKEIRKSILPLKLDRYDEESKKFATLSILLELYKKGYLNDFNSRIVKKLVNISKIIIEKYK